MTRRPLPLPVSTGDCDAVLGLLYRRRRLYRRRIAQKLAVAVGGWAILLVTDDPWWWQAVIAVIVVSNVFLVGIESSRLSRLAADIAVMRTQRSIPYPYRVTLMFIDGLNRGWRSLVIGSPDRLLHLADLDDDE